MARSTYMADVTGSLNSDELANLFDQMLEDEVRTDVSPLDSAQPAHRDDDHDTLASLSDIIASDS
jgi:hypothetical protein